MYTESPVTFTLHRTPNPPQFTPSGHQNDGTGSVWLGVANTQWGDIPCKAVGNNAWFPYGGIEHTTNDFSYVEVRNSTLVKAQNPPVNAIPCGHQKDGAGTLWAAIANTQWGTIPAKASGNTAWFPYDGKEHSTHDFFWVVQNWSTVEYRTHQNPPASAVAANQNDGTGTVYVAIAHTQWGDIPAKAKGNTAWFPYGDKEHTTNNFSWLKVPGHHLEANKGAPPANAISAGHQNDGTGTLWVAIANTQWGTIPAKAKGNTAWFPYAEKEHITSSFSWVVHA